MSRVAAGMRDTEGAREYHDLFIGVGRGELLPYASYYLTGFLNEKPLAKLRGRMAELGIERDPSECASLVGVGQIAVRLALAVAGVDHERGHERNLRTAHVEHVGTEGSERPTAGGPSQHPGEVEDT
mgnify:CR=1 FL=1